MIARYKICCLCSVMVLFVISVQVLNVFINVVVEFFVNSWTQWQWQV